MAAAQRASSASAPEQASRTRAGGASSPGPGTATPNPSISPDGETAASGRAGSMAASRAPRHPSASRGPTSSKDACHASVSAQRVSASSGLVGRTVQPGWGATAPGESRNPTSGIVAYSYPNCR